MRDLVKRTLEAHQGFYKKLLRSAKAAGTIPPGYDVAAASASLLGVLFGMRVMARAGMPKASLRALRDRALEIARILPRTAASNS